MFMREEIIEETKEIKSLFKRQSTAIVLTLSKMSP